MTTHLKQLYVHFMNSNTFQKGAAMAYYTILSLFPILIITISILSIFFSDLSIENEIFIEFKKIVGDELAKDLINIIKTQNLYHNSFFSAFVGFIILAYSSSGVLNQLHSSFNEIWMVETQLDKGLIQIIYKRVVSFFLLLTLIFVISFGVLIQFFLNNESYLNTILNIKILEYLISFIVCTLCFASIYKFIGDIKVSNKIYMYAGILTAILFIFLKTILIWYFKNFHVSSSFGSASLLAVIMIWVYYISQVIFLGASFIFVLKKDNF